MMETYYILTFQNTHRAISGENTLKRQEVKLEIMPTPTSITKSCGICIKVSSSDIEKVKILVKEDKILIKNIYIKDETGYKMFKI